MIAAENDDKLIGPGEAASYFGVHPRTVGRWAELGLLEFIKLDSGQRRYRLGSIRSLLERLSEAPEE